MPKSDRDDAAAGDAIVLRLRQVAFIEARRINLCEDDADDCAMEMVLHALRQAARTAAPVVSSAFGPAVPTSVTVANLVLRGDLTADQTARWLRRCAHNFALNYRRGIMTRRCREVGPNINNSGSFAEGNENPAPVPVAPSAEYDALNGLLHQDVFAAMRELPPHAREVFARFDLQGDTLAEIAFATGKSPNAVKMQLRRARRHLRDVLIQKGYGDVETAPEK